MGIEYERQELRALMLLPIRQLPPYSADYIVASRVGKAVAKHTTLKPWDQFMQVNLEISLREPKALVRFINEVVELAP
jgi:hypothetical protein